MDKASLVQQDQLGNQPWNEPQTAQSHQPYPPAYEGNPQQYPQQPQPQYQPQQQPPPGYPQPPPGYPQTYQPATNVVLVAPPRIVQPAEYVNDNMVLSIVSLFFCCILGIFAIIKSQEARDHKMRGNYDMARMAARTAKNIAIAGIVLGCIGVVVAIILGAVLPLIWVSSVNNDFNNYYNEN